MKTQNSDLRNILSKEHSDNWVALTSDHKKVVGHSKNLVELKNNVGIEGVVYIKVPASGASYSF
jgi:hypothetical protein